MPRPRKLDDFNLRIVETDHNEEFEVTVNFRAVDSSNVELVGWDKANNMYVKFASGAMYAYLGVSRQRAVACAYAQSVGKYVNSKIKQIFPAVRVA